MKLGERLRDLREERGMTQQQLADVLGKSRAAIGKYETGARMPDHSTVQEICDYFGATFDYMTGRSNVRQANTVSVEQCFADDSVITYRGITLGRSEKRAILSMIDAVVNMAKEDKK